MLTFNRKSDPSDISVLESTSFSLIIIQFFNPFLKLLEAFITHEVIANRESLIQDLFKISFCMLMKI